MAARSSTAAGRRAASASPSPNAADECRTSRRHGLRPGHTLHAAAEFERARRARNRLTDELFVVQYAANEGASARLGMAVSTRAAGHSVNRNRLRRLIRESFRMHREGLPAVDVLVSARAASAKATNRAVFESLARFWQAIGTKP